MDVNDVLDLHIVGMTHEGAGVGKKDGMAVFVPYAIKGEDVRARVTRRGKSYGAASLVEVLNPSTARRKPFCAAFARCGGCALQHMSYQEQLEFKRTVVADALERIGGFKGVRVNHVIGMDNPLHYRNKARYSVGCQGEDAVIGFNARDSHEVIEFESCGIQNPAAEEIRKAIARHLHDGGSACDKRMRSLLRGVVVRVSDTTGDITVILAVASGRVPGLEGLIEHIKNEFPKVKSIVLYISKRSGNAVLTGGKTVTVYGGGLLLDRLGKYDFYIPPLSFYQVNSIQTAVLYEKAAELACLTGSETVFDLYCGIGTISIFLAGHAKKVIGVEIFREAVAAARKNARLNKVTNAEFFAGKAEEIVPKLYKDGVRADVVVVDPPRRGCDAALLETVIKMQPERVVYVSCNPATLARDLKILSANGYAIGQVQPVDMFPWTEHVECVVLITRNI